MAVKKHPSAPAGFGVNTSTGKFAKLPPAPSAPSGGGGGGTRDSFGNIVTPVFDPITGKQTGTKFSASPENTALAQAKTAASIPSDVLKTALQTPTGRGMSSEDIARLEALSNRVSTPVSSSITSGSDIDTEGQTGQRISNVEELNRLAAQGLTEADITRAGGDIFLKPDSQFATGDISTPTTGVPTGGDADAGTGTGTGDATSEDPFLKAMQDLLEFQKGRPSVLDQFKQFREELGLGAKEERLSGIQEQVVKTEQLLDDLEGNINERISGQGVNEALRQRILASERKPLTEQLGDLARAEQVALAGVTAGRQQLSDLITLHAQQEDNLFAQQETALKIAERQSELLTEAGEDERDIVKGYVTKYPDAGITLDDTLEEASAKLASSKIYQKAIKGASGEVGETVPGLTPTDKRKLDGVQLQLKGTGIDLNSLSDETRNFIANTMSQGDIDKWINEMKTTGQSIDPINFKTGGSETTETEEAKVGKFLDKNYLITNGIAEEDVPAFLAFINERRAFGENDQQILEQLIASGAE